MELTPISRRALLEDELEPKPAPDEVTLMENAAHQLPALNSSSADDAVEVARKDVVPKGDATSRTRLEELATSTTLETADLSQQEHDTALVNSLQQLMDDCLQLSKDQKVLLAKEKLDKLECAISELSEAAADLTGVKSIVDRICTKKTEFDEIRQTASVVEDVMRDVEGSENWTPVAEDKKKGLRTFCRWEDGLSTVSIKVVADMIDCHVFNLIALINEVDLLEHVLKNRLVKVKTDLLKQVSLFRKIIHIQVGLPWPLSGRDVVADARGSNVLHQGAIVITGASIDESPCSDLKLPEVEKGYTRMDVTWSGGVLRPINDHQTKVSAVFNLDFRLALVPHALINFFTQRLSLPFLKLFVARASNLEKSAEHNRRIETNVEFYSEIRRSFDEYFTTLQAPVLNAEKPNAEEVVNAENPNAEEV